MQGGDGPYRTYGEAEHRMSVRLHIRVPSGCMDDLLEPAAGVSLLRPLEDRDIQCPAGERKGEAGCFCSVEGGLIDGRRDTSSITAFCMGDYTSCPTWQAEKEHVWAQQGAKGLVESRRVVRPGLNHAAKMERLNQAREIMWSNTREGRAMRLKLGMQEWV